MLRSPLLHFLVAGGALFLMEAAWSWAPETPVVTVMQSEIDERRAAYQLQMGRPASEAETRSIEDQVVDDALWLEQAFSLGLLDIDPVVRQRLLLNMRFLEGASDATATEASVAASRSDPSPDTRDPASEEELIARAIELGMDRSDTVVQRRLIDRVQAIIRAGVRAEPPSRAQLDAHYAETAERWREPALLDLSHVYLSRDKRGEASLQDATALLSRLEAEEMEIEIAIREGDPFLAGHRLRGASPSRIVARLGPTFAAGVESAPIKTWVGPVESAFGLHLVWIHDRIASRIPALAEIEKRVFEDWIEQESRKALREYLEERRTVVDIRIVDDVAADAG